MSETKGGSHEDERVAAGERRSAVSDSQTLAERELRAALRQRILIIDGAMGTMIQRHRLDDAAFRGTRFASHPKELRGANDLLCLTQPEIIEGIHRQYLEAGVGSIQTRTLSAQSVEASWSSASHSRLLSVGINCALGAREMRPHIEELAHVAPLPISCYPNAGLPNALGAYDETPSMMSDLLRDFAENNWINIVGGCCGTTPEHIEAIREAVKDLPPRVPQPIEKHLRLSGLEPLTVRRGGGRSLRSPQGCAAGAA